MSSDNDSRRGFLKKLGFMGGCAAGVTIIIDYGDRQEREEIEPPTADPNETADNETDGEDNDEATPELEMGEPMQEDNGTDLDDDETENEDENETGDENDDEQAPDAPSEEAGNVQLAVEQAIADRVNNDFRAGEGLDPLSYDDSIAAVARAHSQDMIDRDFFEHTNPDGEDPVDRLENAGIECNGSGENIAYEGGYDLDSMMTVADSLAEAWFNSQGHRENILGDYDRHGVGVAIDDEGTVYATHVFCAD